MLFDRLPYRSGSPSQVTDMPAEAHGTPTPRAEEEHARVTDSDAVGLRETPRKRSAEVRRLRAPARAPAHTLSHAYSGSMPTIYTATISHASRYALSNQAAGN